MKKKYRIEHSGAEVLRAIMRATSSFAFLNPQDFAALYTHLGKDPLQVMTLDGKKIYVRKHIGCVCIKPIMTPGGIYT